MSTALQVLRATDLPGNNRAVPRPFQGRFCSDGKSLENRANSQNWFNY